MSRIALVCVLLLGCAPTRLPRTTIAWQTASEFGVAGYIVERGAAPDGPFERISPLIPSGDDPFIRNEYEYVDLDVNAGHTYHYRLDVVSNDNTLRVSGQLAATAR